MFETIIALACIGLSIGVVIGTVLSVASGRRTMRRLEQTQKEIEGMQAAVKGQWR